MPSVDKQAVRAEVTLGDYITIRTPDVLSFNIKKSRGQMSATFSASLRVPYYEFGESVDLLADKVVIKAGVGTSFSNLPVLFTGKIYKCVINPVRTDASKVVLNISGKDIMAIMEGQKINRRVKTYRDGSSPPERWGIINNVIKHNTPKRKSFSHKIYTSDKLGVYDMPRKGVIRTPDPYKNENTPNRASLDKVFGSMIIEKQIGE